MMHRFKKQLLITLIIALSMFLSINAFAEVGPAYYYNGKDEKLEEYLQKEGESEARFVSWLETNHFKSIADGNTIDEETFKIDYISLDRTKAVWWTRNWTKEKFAEFFDTKDKVLYLQQNSHSTISHQVYIPLYYKGEYQIYAALYYYNSITQTYFESDNPIDEETSDLIIQERLLERLKEYGLSDWVPQHIATVEGFTFVLCEKENETIAVYMPTRYTTRYCEAFHKAFTEQRTFTKDQLLSALTEYQTDLAKRLENEEIGPYGGGSVSEEETTPQANTLWWILGGAVVLIAILLTVILTLKKKKA